MKKRIVSPFLSALVIPGLGQIVNGQVAKGSILLGGVTTLFILMLFKVLSDVARALNSLPNPRLNPQLLGELAGVLARQDHTFLIVLVVLFACLWVYSVVDAYRTGKRLDGSVS